MKAGQNQDRVIRGAEEQRVGKSAQQRAADAPIDNREMMRGTSDVVELAIKLRQKGVCEPSVSVGIPVVGGPQIGLRVP